MRIRRGFAIACALILALSAAGCASGPGPATGDSRAAEAVGGTPSPGVQPSRAETQNPDAERAKADMARFLRLVQARDAEGLLQFLKGTDFYADYKPEDAAKAIEGFEASFDLPSLTATLDESGSSPGIRQFAFKLADRNSGPSGSGTEGREDWLRATVGYEADNGRPVVHHPLVRYYPYAEKMVRQYANLIADGKASELARFLNADDLEVADAVAEATIRTYRDRLDCASLSVREDAPFAYTIEDRLRRVHSIEVVYGDGLMGIRDSYRPDFNG